MDRYLYDELADLPLRNLLSRAFFRLLVGLAPRPHLAFLLDADPEAARPATRISSRVHARNIAAGITRLRSCWVTW